MSTTDFAASSKPIKDKDGGFYVIESNTPLTHAYKKISIFQRLI